jgi:transposase
MTARPKSLSRLLQYNDIPVSKFSIAISHLEVGLVKVFREPEVPEHQLLLLPPNVADFVAEDTPVRILSELVDSLDLSALRKPYKGGGAPAYDPVILFKVLVYGMSEGIRGSRRLARALTYDLRFMYLARMSRPDFRTICRFRRLQEEAISVLFTKTVVKANAMGLVLLEHGSVDGTKIGSQASRRSYRNADDLAAYLAKTNERIAQILREMEETDQAEDAEHGDGPGDGIPDELRTLEARKKLLERATKDLESQGTKGVVTTDPESRLMKTAAGVRPSYNAQAVVDSAAQIIVAAEVTQDAVDARQLRPMLEQAKRTLEALPETVTADAGYWSKESLDYVEKEKLDAYIAPKGVKEDNLAGWEYDKETDILRSPEGEVYVYSTKRKSRGRTYRGYRRAKPVHVKWVNNDRIQIARMREKVATPEGRAIYKRRQTIVEPVFGHIKGPLGLQKLLLRGLSGAKIEYLLACITHNLGKMVSVTQMNATPARA